MESVTALVPDQDLLTRPVPEGMLRHFLTEGLVWSGIGVVQEIQSPRLAAVSGVSLPRVAVRPMLTGGDQDLLTA